MSETGLENFSSALSAVAVVMGMGSPKEAVWTEPKGD